MYLFTFKFSTLASPTNGQGTAWERIQARDVKRATLALYRKRRDIDQVLGVIQENSRLKPGHGPKRGTNEKVPH